MGLSPPKPPPSGSRSAKSLDRYRDAMMAWRESEGDVPSSSRSLPQEQIKANSDAREKLELRVAAIIASISQMLEQGAFVPVLEIPTFAIKVEPHGKYPPCGCHLDCQHHKFVHWTAISSVFPSCWCRHYVRRGASYYVVFSGQGELSEKIGLGETECAAWIDATSRFANRGILGPYRNA